MNDTNKLVSEFEKVFVARVTLVEAQPDGVYLIHAKRKRTTALDKTPYMTALGKLVDGRPVFANTKYDVIAA